MQITNYKQAAAHEAAVIPIRQSKTNAYAGVKPLANRRRPFESISRDGRDVVLSLLGRKIVRYKPSGIIEVAIPYGLDSQLNNFLTKYLNFSCFNEHGKGWFNVADPKTNDPKHPTKVLYFKPKETLRLRLNPGAKKLPSPRDRWVFSAAWIARRSMYLCLNPEKFVATQVKKDRKHAAAVRRRYADFIGYAKNMIKIMGDAPVATETWLAVFGESKWQSGAPDYPTQMWTPVALQKAEPILDMAASGDSAQYLKAMLMLGVDRNWRSTKEFNPAFVLRFFEHCLMRKHAKEMLYEAKCTTNITHADPLRHYFVA